MHALRRAAAGIFNSAEAPPLNAKLPLWLVCLSACAGGSPPATAAVPAAPLRLPIVHVYDGPGSSGFGIFHTSPESPDGTRIAYVRFADLGTEDMTVPLPASLWVCDRDATHHVRLRDLTVTVHNGAGAFWVDDDRLAYGQGGEIFVIDARTGETLLGPYRGTIGHDAFDRRLLFFGPATDGGRVGVYELDGLTGELMLLRSLDELRAIVRERTGEELGNLLVHLQYSADGSWISFRDENTLMVSLRADGGEVRPFPRPKPLHQLWYDASTYMGVGRENVPAGGEWHYYRWDLDGTLLEKLAGPLNHGAASPDRQWYAGETARYGAAPVRFALYRRSETTPTAVLWVHSSTRPVWTRQAHVNPAFSRDGRRLYFWMPVSEREVRASFVELPR